MIRIKKDDYVCGVFPKCIGVTRPYPCEFSYNEKTHLNSLRNQLCEVKINDILKNLKVKKK
jgi:hypothetical protein